MKRLLVIVVLALLPVGAWAQDPFGASSVTNTISATTSNWTGTAYNIGSNYVFDVLELTGAGVLSNGNGVIGLTAIAHSNKVVVTGAGSYWRNAGSLTVGGSGSWNSLVVSNAGTVSAARTFIGNLSGSKGNTVFVTGTGSHFNSGTLQVGQGGSQNSVTFSGGAQGFASQLQVGNVAAASNNLFLITDAGTLWSNSSTASIGYSGQFNTLIVSNGAVFNNSSGQDLQLGGLAAGSNNTIIVTGTGSTIGLTGRCVVGESAGFNTLIVESGGKVKVEASGFRTGRTISSSNNTVWLKSGGTLDVAGALIVISNSTVMSFGLGSANNPIMNCATLTIGQSTLAVQDSGGFAAGTYQLISYTAKVNTNGAANCGFTIGTMPPGFTYTVTQLGTLTGSGSIALNATATGGAAAPSAGIIPPFFQ
jgi:T5SS/PEP-CTERM-associated repeat protein